MPHDHSKPFTPEEDALVAAEAFEEGDLPHAVYHLAGAIYAEPDRQDWRALLARIFAAAPDPVDLIPLRPKGLWVGEALIRALALDWVGRKTESLAVLLQVAAQPNPRMLPVVAAAAEGPAVLAVGPQLWAHFFSLWTQRLPGLRAEADQLPVVENLLPLAEVASTAWPEDGALAAIFLALLRKGGRDAEAQKIGPRLYEQAPGWPVAVMMAQLYLAREERRRAVGWFKKAIEFKPDDLSVRNDLGDIYLDEGEISEAMRWYAEVLAKEPEESWAFPSALYCLAVDGNQAAADRLTQLAELGNPRALQLTEKTLPLTDEKPD